VTLYFSSQTNFADSESRITFLCAAQYITIAPVFYIGLRWGCMGSSWTVVWPAFNGISHTEY